MNVFLFLIRRCLQASVGVYEWGSLKIGKCVRGIQITGRLSAYSITQPQYAGILSWHFADELASKLRRLKDVCLGLDETVGTVMTRSSLKRATCESLSRIYILMPALASDRAERFVGQ